MRKRVFGVGRRGGKTTTLVVMRIESGPIAGPWTLRAVVSEN